MTTHDARAGHARPSASRTGTRQARQPGGPAGPADTPPSEAGGSPARIIHAGAADLDALSRVIADAFDDLPPSRWLIPSQTARDLIFPPYFAIFVEHALTSGIVHTTPDRAAVALWLPADGQPPPPPGYDTRLAAATGPWLDRFRAFDAALEGHHPAGPHHHLAMLAVRPGRQGCGIGTALLNAHHAELDRLGLPAYLEAASLRTRGVYLRRGYADHGTRPIRLPDDGPRMWPMIREPAAPRP